jgi:hypothetical protein
MKSQISDAGKAMIHSSALDLSVAFGDQSKPAGLSA